MKKVLMHTCCAPCSVNCIQQLRAEGIEPVSFWYNPNIHPYQEYKARRDTLMAYAPTIGMELIVEECYGLDQFVQAVASDIPHRCGKCYAMRLYETARYAAEHGFEAFTSTLFISPYQNHELLKKVAAAAAEKYGVTFLYRDFRPGFKAGQEEARALGFYMQKYCGCVFSEEDRYRKQIDRDLAEQLKLIHPPKQQTRKAGDIIREKLAGCGDWVTVETVNGLPCAIRDGGDGLSFESDKLPMRPNYRYEVFTMIVDYLLSQDGCAKKGSGRHFKPNENSVVAYVARNYPTPPCEGPVFDPVFVLSAVLDWAGICKNMRGKLALTTEYLDSL